MSDLNPSLRKAPRRAPLKASPAARKERAPSRAADVLQDVRDLTWSGQHERAIDAATVALASPRLADADRIRLLDARAESHIAQGAFQRARDDAAAAKAEAAGLKVVMNRCPKIEYGRLSSEISWMGVNSRTLSAKRAPMPLHGQRLSLNRQSVGGGNTVAADRAAKGKTDPT